MASKHVFWRFLQSEYDDLEKKGAISHYRFVLENADSDNLYNRLVNPQKHAQALKRTAEIKELKNALRTGKIDPRFAAYYRELIQTWIYDRKLHWCHDYRDPDDSPMITMIPSDIRSALRQLSTWSEIDTVPYPLKGFFVRFEEFKSPTFSCKEDIDYYKKNILPLERLEKEKTVKAALMKLNAKDG